MADHGEAGLLECAAGKEDYALPRATSISIAVGKDADFGVHPFVEDFVRLKLGFGKVGGTRWGGRHPDSVGAEGGFFDFDRFKGVATGIGGNTRQ